MRLSGGKYKYSDEMYLEVYIVMRLSGGIYKYSDEIIWR